MKAIDRRTGQLTTPKPKDPRTVEHERIKADEREYSARKVFGGSLSGMTTGRHRRGKHRK